MPTNPPFVCNNKSLSGAVTGSEAWQLLKISGHAKESSCISKQDSPDVEQLTTKFAAIKTSHWTEETDMYPDITYLTF